MSITRQLCEKCGFPMAHCSCVTPIEIAFNSALKRLEQDVPISGFRLSDETAYHAYQEFKRELAKAVPAKDYLQPHSEICQCGDCGWNECRKAFLGEAE